jgi:hypothetical protein
MVSSENSYINHKKKEDCFMLTVQGIYEKGLVQIKESIPDFEKREVFVTFLPIAYEIKCNNEYLLSEPKLKSIKEKNKAIDDLLGICEGNLLTLDDVKQERLSRQ